MRSGASNQIKHKPVCAPREACKRFKIMKLISGVIILCMYIADSQKQR